MNDQLFCIPRRVRIPLAQRAALAHSRLMGNKVFQGTPATTPDPAPQAAQDAPAAPAQVQPAPTIPVAVAPAPAHAVQPILEPARPAKRKNRS